MNAPECIDPAARCANALRFLAADAVEQARSGHPGAPMGMAEMAEVLWRRHLRHNPANPAWPDRDRFVLSCGHASMLLYSLLHLAGIKAVNAQYEQIGKLSVTLDDIKRFRQLDSKCPDRKSTRLNSSHIQKSRMPSSA